MPLRVPVGAIVVAVEGAGVPIYIVSYTRLHTRIDRRATRADVLIVNGDPMEDIHTLTNLRTVTHNGLVIRDR